MGNGFKSWSTNDVLTSADVNGFLMVQSVAAFATTANRDAQITSPEEGQVAYTRADNTYWWHDGSAWRVLLLTETAYTPTLGGTGWSIGNGTFAASYVRVGDLVSFSAVLSIGSTTTLGTPPPNFTLPVATSEPLNYTWFEGFAQQASTSGMYPLRWQLVSSTQVRALAMSTSGTYAQATNVTSTVPFAWASGHRLSVRGSYVAA